MNGQENETHLRDFKRNGWPVWCGISTKRMGVALTFFFVAVVVAGVYAF
jgi:hypothetical protein